MTNDAMVVTYRVPGTVGKGRDSCTRSSEQKTSSLGVFGKSLRYFTHRGCASRKTGVVILIVFPIGRPLQYSECQNSLSGFAFCDGSSLSFVVVICHSIIFVVMLGSNEHRWFLNFDGVVMK